MSSSGHLVLVPWVTGWSDQGLLMDVAVHVGTLGAVMLYFYRDIGGMLAGLGRQLRGRRDPGARLFWLLVLATIPVVAAGYGLNRYLPGGIRGVEVIGWATLGFGLALWVADHLGMTVRRIEHLRVSDALIIGISQVLALIPGTSRSGITMTAARLMGMERPSAARFSMLMSIPTIIAAGVLKGWELYQTGNLKLAADVVLAAGLSLVAALIAIALMMAWLKRSGFGPFVIYRVALGGVILAYAYGLIG